MSSIPSSAIPDTEISFPIDKVIHFIEYGIFGFLVFMALFTSGKVTAGWSVVLAIVSAAFLGTADELYQSLTRRETSFYDWLADCFGATVSSLGVFIYTKYRKRLKKGQEF